MRVIYIILLLFPFLASSQQSDLYFFTDDGQRFSLFLNGQNQNPGFGTSVKASVSPGGYRVKVVFDTDTLGLVEKTLEIKPYVAYSFQVKKKATPSAIKDVKRIGKVIHRELTAPSDTGQLDGEDRNKYHLVVISEVSNAPVGQTAAPTYSTQPGQSAQVQQQTQSTSSQTTVTGSSTSTSTTVHSGTDQAQISVNMNVGVPVGGVVYEERTTTTVTTSGGQTAQQVYVLPGYSGPVGCNWPLSPQEFQGVKSTISAQTWDETKLTIAKQVISSNCLLSGQVRDIMMLFGWEETRLDLAKYAYGYTFDIGNYYKLNDAFEWESSVTELNQYIQSTGR